MAVHFCPALDVISRATSFTNRPNSGSPRSTDAPRMQQFNESASWLNGILRATIFGCVLSMRPVFAEPVNVTTSCSVR